MTKLFLIVLCLQVALERRGFSPNALDGVFGSQTKAALTAYCAEVGRPVPATPQAAYDTLFHDEENLLCAVSVTDEDYASLTSIPEDPADKATLSAMGYQTILEMYAERGHTSEKALKKLNPKLDWPNPPVGSIIRLPAVQLPPPPTNDIVGPKASLLRVSLSRLEVRAYDAQGKIMLMMPCSIAANKAKLPPQGSLVMRNCIANPNYTFTPDNVVEGEKVRRHIFPPGPNNPVGVAWMGLSLPGYGIHGTPFPERIGRAESHGCFRLSNWNAERLRRICKPGLPVVVE